MKFGIFCLVLGYMLSQFYRAFLAVLTPYLATDLGASADDLSRASGLWFLAFAGMQIPVGWALDKIGPRLTASVLLAVGGAGGAAVFATAQSVFSVQFSMVLIGIGCSSVLMSSYYIFARVYSAAIFATLAGAMIGIGSLGNIAGSLPLAWSAETYGWRDTLALVSALTLVISAALFVFVKDPPRPDTVVKGSVFDLLKIPALWLILPMMFVNYAPSAGIRGLWIGPYFSDIYGASSAGIGQVTLIMGIAMIAGNFAYGPLDRLFGTRKWVIWGGNVLSGLACVILFAVPDSGFWLSTALLACVGFFGSSFGVIVAHGRSFFPSHLTGRGVTLLNLFGIGGAGIMQIVSAKVHSATSVIGVTGTYPYSMIFLTFGLFSLAGACIYTFSQDRMD